jgi:hypothetical protein
MKFARTYLIKILNAKLQTAMKTLAKTHSVGGLCFPLRSEFRSPHTAVWQHWQGQLNQSNLRILWRGHVSQHDLASVLDIVCFETA